MKSKLIFSSSFIGIVLMMAGQLSFSINDSIVKLIVNQLNSNLSSGSVEEIIVEVYDNDGYIYSKSINIIVGQTIISNSNEINYI